MPSRCRARATLPHGQSQLVGVEQRYSVAMVALEDTTHHAADHAQRYRLSGAWLPYPRRLGLAIPGDRRLQAVLVRGSAPAELALGLGVRERPVQRGDADLHRRWHLEPAHAPGARR